MDRQSVQTVPVPEEAASAVRPRLVTIHDCSVYLGLSVHTLYTMVSERRIPFVKVGRLVKFDLSLVDAWINKRTMMPISPPRT
jgi:excisionase family DNA binding protein